MANMHLVTGYAGKTHVTAADHGAFWAAVVGDGEYILDTGGKFAANIVTNNQIRISDGEMLIQGRHCRIPTGETVDLTIENGTAGTKRNDLIVARYTKSEETGVEEMNLVVIQGEPSETTPKTPEYKTGNIFNGDKLHDFLLYKVTLNDVDIVKIEPSFNVTLLSLYDTVELLKATEGNGLPSPSLVGVPGAIYIDTSVTPNICYMCLGKDGSNYIWSRVLVNGYVKKEVATEIITATTTWVVPPELLRNESVLIRVFGGGGGAGTYSYPGGGGGGEMAVYNDLLTEDSYDITIGNGGAKGSAGGVTSFGSLVSASGGSPGSSTNGNGGNGGTGGGGSGRSTNSGGNGGSGTYGGGGGGGGFYSLDYTGGNGGSGGTYGGGGGGGGNSGTGGTGGTYGGNGGNGKLNATGETGKTGTNTTSLNVDFPGNGSGGGVSSTNGGGSGGGGYGGNGGSTATRGGSGGGGYGGTGGTTNGTTPGGGGGGGYGGTGGTGSGSSPYPGGGGGGYGSANYGAGGTNSAGHSGVVIITYKKLAFVTED